jgi:hypothetical protein
MQPQDEPNEEERQEKLDGDYSTPFSPPSGIQDSTDDTQPSADTDVDVQEHYDAGISAASGVEDRGSEGILSYDPNKARPGSDKL